MKFNQFLQEKIDMSLLSTDDVSTNNQTADVSTDESEIMDSLVFNFIGFLGLTNLNSKSSFLKQAERTDKTTNLDSASEESGSSDVTLAIKRAVDAKFIRQGVAFKLLRIFQKIKGKKLDSASVTDEFVKTIIDEIRFGSNKPSTRVYSLIKSFVDGSLNLPLFTRELYFLSKQKRYMTTAAQFRTLVIKGKYLKILNSLSNNELSEPEDDDQKPNIKTDSIKTPDSKSLSNFFFKS